MSYILKIYKKFVTPFLRQIFGDGCRFEPTCSVYTHDSIKRFGMLKGGTISLKRILRCHPFTNSSHFDPVPTHYVSR